MSSPAKVFCIVPGPLCSYYCSYLVAWPLRSEPLTARRDWRKRKTQLDAMAAPLPGVERITLRYADVARDLDGCAHRLGAWLGIDLDNEERVRWVKEGPRVPADSMRARVWRAVVTAMVVDG